MLQKILLISISIFALISCENNYLETEKKIRSITEIICWSESNCERGFETVFDTSGQILLELQYSDKLIFRKNEYFYKNGLLDKIVSYDDSDSVFSYTLNLYGDSIEMPVLDPNYIYNINIYSNNNELKLKTTKGSDIDFSESYEYDNNGNLVSEEKLFNGSLTTINYVHDQMGRVIDKKEYIEDQDFLIHTSYEYENNKLIQENDHLGASIVGKINYSYDDFDRLEKEIHSIKSYSNNWKDRKTITYIYNEYDDLIEETTQSDGSVNVYSYSITYDPQGNWISKTKYKNGEWSEEERREIEYF